MDNFFVHFCLQYVRLLLRMRLPHIVRLIYIVRLPYLVRLLHIVRLPSTVRLPIIVRLLHIMSLPDMYASCFVSLQKEDIKTLFCTLRVRLSNISEAVTHSEAASHREEASCDTDFS